MSMSCRIELLPFNITNTNEDYIFRFSTAYANDALS